MSTENKAINYPDPLASDELKKTNAYGLGYAKAISQEWFNGGVLTDNCQYSRRRLKIRNNRLFTRGKQSLDTYKKSMEDLTHMNVDWTPLNIAGKFIDIVANGIREELYRVDISAIDRIATMERKEYQERLQKNMRTKSMLEKTKQLLGIDLVPRGFIPQDNEELEMHMSLSYKPSIEIAEELLIKFIKGSNNWSIIKQMVDRDLVENALGSVRCYTDKTNGVVLKYVDIENYLHGRVKKKDFTDCQYHAVAEEFTLGELKSSAQYDDATLRAIAEQCSTINGNEKFGVVDFSRTSMDAILGFKINVLYFTYKTTKTINYKKKNNQHGGFKMIQKNADYNPPVRSDYKKESKILDTWYEGNYVVGTDYLYNYKESEILSRDSLNRALPPFITFASDIYENELHSLSERSQPIINQMQRVHLKIQQLVAMMRPDETEIDIDLLAELESKTGQKLGWEDMIALYNAKGIVLSTRVDMGDEGIKDRAALRVPTQMQSGKLEQLTRVWLHYANIIRDLTGINEARDGSQTSDALVGVSEMRLMQSNTATQGISDASIEISRKTAETISTRVGDIFRWGKGIAEVYKNAVGANNLEVIESLDDRHLHEFGFLIQMLPTESELQDFKESLNIALESGSIGVDDKIKAQRISKMNVKQAEAYLTYRLNKNMEENNANEDARMQSKAEADANAAKQAEQSRQQTAQMASELKIKEAKELAIIEVMKQNELNKVNRPDVERSYEIDVFIEELKRTGKIEERSVDNDRKDSRQKMVDTHKSKLMEQGKKETGSSIDFQTNRVEPDLSYFNQ